MNTDEKPTYVADKFEMWFCNKNAQYRIRETKMTDEIELLFWVPNETTFEKFETTYENLIKIMKDSDRTLCKPRP